ncbi:F-box protein SKIP23-like [Punica granatum]|uniref:F-box protein SKIP23-like n=2 Tax=Punica granatum TaxID=22663 RepID=A0A6P8CE33_PUNGR|nr:F-box protein SKIP23-like [Punica granatum]
MDPCRAPKELQNLIYYKYFHILWVAMCMRWSTLQLTEDWKYYGLLPINKLLVLGFLGCPICIMANWSALPYSVILHIAQRLAAVEDFVAFSSVCFSWRAVYIDRGGSPRSRVPWLMLSEDQNSEKRRFYSLSNGRTYYLPLPNAQVKMCWGSPLGWLVTFGPDFMLRLLNPFSQVEIDIPQGLNCEDDSFPLGKEWYRLLYKAIVLRDPTEDGDFLVAGIFYQGKFLSFKSRDGAWMMLEDPADLCYGFSDAVCFGVQIYALQGIGALVLIEMDSEGCPRATPFAPPPRDEWAWEDAYLLEFSGDLLMVQKLECFRDDVRFEVYQFDFSSNGWNRLNDLGDTAIFVGGNHSMAISTSSVDGICKPNCIYFIGDGVEQWWHYSENAEQRDMGVYDMSDGSVQPFFYGADYPSYYSRPLWVVPRFL